MAPDETPAGLGRRFAAALGAKDVDALAAILAPEVDFRALTPGATWEAAGASALIADTFFGQWFEPSDRITGVLAVDTAEVGPRHRVTYRLAVTNADGDHLVEQQAYYDVVGGAISWLRILCSGFQPVKDQV